MTNQEKIAELFGICEEIEVYGRTLGKLSFDMECCAPEEGIGKAGEDMAVVGKRIHQLTHSEKYERLVCELHADSEGLTPLQKKTVEHLYEDYEKSRNLSEEFSYEWERARGKAYGDWLAAKKAGDFSLFRDIFGKLIEYTRKSVDLRDRKYSSYYNACLDDYEKGGNEEQMDAFFAQLKARIVPLVRRIAAEGKPIREDFLTRYCPIAKQEETSRYLMKLEGLRESALVFMTTEHPFTTNFGAGDVRVTTHFYENSFVSNIFTTLHEGGHALFMQNEPAEFAENHTADRMTSAMHETISRFYENIVGRSEAFIHFVYPQLQKMGGDVLSDVTEREFYEAVNISRPSLIRTESDELTYCLHIMIRYEMEKAFVNGDITVDEIPGEWNRKYKEYLGVDVPNDVEGCLQDVHWTGMYGYFPSYALGNAYGAQILRTMEKDFDVFGTIRAGGMDKVLSWLKEHVFSTASVSTPDEWIRGVSGESLNVNYYLDYLEEKFTEIYGLK